MKKHMQTGIGSAVLAGMLSAVMAPNALAQDSSQATGGITALDAVTVTGTRTEKLAIEVPAAISVIGREEIELAQPQSLDDIVKMVPGLEMSGGSRDTAEQPNIRGFSGSQVVIRVDGVRKNFEAGHRGQIFLDPTMMSQVDVLRGPSSVLYGTGAIGGVINLTSVSAEDLLAPGENFGVRLRTGFQLNNTEKLGTISAYGRPSDDSHLLFSFTGSNSDDYDDGSGDSIPGSNDDIAAWMAKGGFDLNGHSLTGLVQGYNNDHIIPVAANTNSESFADRTTREFSSALTYAYQGMDDLLDVNATAYYTVTDLREIRFSDQRREETTNDTLGLDASNTSRFGLTDWSSLALTAGLEIFEDEQTGLRNGNSRAEFPDATRLSQGYFLQGEFALFDVLTLTPALRYDMVELNADNQTDVSEDRLTKQLSASYQFAPWLTGFATYAEAFRAPSLTELYVGGTHFAFNTFVANTGLRPELAENKEVGLAFSFNNVLQERDGLRVRGSVYQNDVDDLIELRVTGGAFGTSTNINVTQARIRGAELELAYDSSSFFGGLGYSRARGDDVDNDTPLSSIPEDKGTLSFGYRWAELGLTAGWRSIYYAGQGRVPTGTEAVDGKKVLHDLYVSWVPVEENLDGLRVDFGIDNVFDKNYQRYLSELREAGRNFKLSASMKF